MTTAAESHDAQLAAIKARHQVLADQIADPKVTCVEMGDAPSTYQLGLSNVWIDPIGRFWTIVVTQEQPRKVEARMVFDPFSLSRPRGPYDPAKMPMGSDPDDTQAAQGFKAHEGDEPPIMSTRRLKEELNASQQRWSCEKVELFHHGRTIAARIAAADRKTTMCLHRSFVIRDKDIPSLVADIREYAEIWVNGKAA